MKSNLEELDELATKFIIGHKKLTIEQKDILDEIRILEKEHDIIENKKKSVERLIKRKYKKLAEAQE